MNLPNGLLEELKHKFRLYPETNLRTYPLHPQEYANALMQQLTRDVAVILEELAINQKFDEMTMLVDEVRTNLRSKVKPLEGQVTLETPLEYVHYRYDGESIPFFPNTYLTHPSFISNNKVSAEEQNLYKTLKFELLTADSVELMVSFIRWSGLQLLWRSFLDLARRKTPVRILTTNYLNVTEPKALRKLLCLPNVALRMFITEHESFHTKAYMFDRDSGLDTLIIGSSNISHSALKTGHEWNVKLPRASHSVVFSSAKAQFQNLWNAQNSFDVTEELIRHYEQDYQQAKGQQGTSKEKIQSPVQSFITTTLLTAEGKPTYQPEDTIKLKPNEMQRPALAALEQTRKNGYTKGVIVAATGTGKTYLSAFDAQSFGAKSVLFLAHRDELLENAKETFIEVFGNANLCGKLTGFERQFEKPFLFSTVQMMYREDVLSRFKPGHFDYIVVDEFHHAQANTYRQVLDYFQPKFLLGLTATPERMDGRDVLELCEHNLVYEIRLRDALSEGLLAPFHYFGLSDPTVNYDEIEQRSGRFVEQALVGALRTHERVDYVIEMMEKFGHDGDRRVALGFCATIDHAQFMAEEFNLRGYSAAVLTGKDAPDVRRATIARLEGKRDPLEFIFTVDIFNEGIDIPEANLLLFLRPTESATIFLQQLGRGLRKTKNKEYVTVLDFIGNYQKSFVVPLALSGQFNHRVFDKDSLRIAVETEFADLPDGCAVDLEPVSREQILKKIEEVRLDRNQVLADMYRDFKSLLGRAPEIEDFLYTEDAPSLYYFISKYQSWVETKRRMGDANASDEALLDSPQLLLVRQLEKMLPLKWPYEFVVLQEALSHSDGSTSVKQVFTRLIKRFGEVVTYEQHASFIERAMQRLANHSAPKAISVGAVISDTFTMHPDIQAQWDTFRDYLNKRLDYGLIEFQRTYLPAKFFGNQESMILYQNYTRNDLIFLFQANVQEGSWREGISKVRNHYLLFINLKKDESVEEHLRYHDHFIDSQTFHWQSANQTSHQSDRGQDYVYHKERGIHIHLFIRKFEQMHGVTLPFTYLGEVDYVSSHGDKPMNITWKLHCPVPSDLFMDFIR